MLCARRGESWKQKHRTLYPSSLSVAAADAPASPLPTTITVCFRLLAGFTNFISKRCRSHFFSMGPAGIFARSSMETLTTHLSRLTSHVSLYHPCIHRQRNHRKPQPYEYRQHPRQAPPQRVGRRLAETQTTASAPDAMVEMESHRHHGDEVECHHEGAAESRGDVVVGITLNKVGVDRPQSEM